MRRFAYCFSRFGPSTLQRIRRSCRVVTIGRSRYRKTMARALHALPAMENKQIPNNVDGLPAVRVLVADDEVCTRMILKAYLEQAGYAVTLAKNGDEATALAKEILPHVLVVDYMIPPSDGRRIAEAVRADPSTAQIPIVLLTGSVRLADKAPGPWNVRLQKPPRANKLVETVRMLTGRARSGQPSREAHSAGASRKRELPPAITAKFLERLAIKVQEMRSSLNSTATSAADRTVLDNIRGHMHQLHGCGSLCGFPYVGEIAGKTEAWLEEWLDSGQPPSRAELDHLRDAIDAIESASVHR
ncbi:MAG: response regulator [Candidatus Binatia bacterium]